MSDFQKYVAFVSIVGCANVGKSSILNMLVNHKISIVSPKPQTTRNRITGIFTKDNFQIVFLDTPGFHRGKTNLEKFMLQEVDNSFSDVDVIMYVVEAGKELKFQDNLIIGRLKNSKIPVILCINKVDKLKNKSLILEQINNFVHKADYNAVIPTSAITGFGRSDLLDEIKKIAKPSPFLFPVDEVTDQSERTLTAEIIREKILLLLNQEVPHGTAVFVESMKNINDKYLEISAVIHCEKNNHKSIIIGKKGAMIKQIGSLARIDLEKFFNCKILLNLWVNVKPDWKNKNTILKDLGYLY